MTVEQQVGTKVNEYSDRMRVENKISNSKAKNSSTNNSMMQSDGKNKASDHYLNQEISVATDDEKKFVLD